MEISTKFKELLRSIKNRKLLLFIFDAFTFFGVYCVMVLATLISGKNIYSDIFVKYLPNFLIFISFVLTARLAGRVYSTLWRYANSSSFLKMVLVDSIGGALSIIVTLVIPGVYIGNWESVSVVALFNVASLSFRFFYQWCYRQLNKLEGEHDNNKTRVAIVGAGQVGALLAEELTCTTNSVYRPVCFIDTAKDKVGSLICGLRVLTNVKKPLSLSKSLV